MRAGGNGGNKGLDFARQSAERKFFGIIRRYAENMF